MEEWLSPEGNSGAFLQYAAARARSILRKASERGKELDPSVELDSNALSHPAERAVLLGIAGLASAVADAARELRPVTLCVHLRNLAQAYSSFQNHRDCNVILSEGSTLQSRLLLVHAAAEALTWGLEQLGIDAPARI
jgi:arginyl-tRNA synthetase